MTAVRVFDAAARHLNFTRAADELAMTQAAVSYQIKVLEDRVGSPLFERGPRGVSLTPRGKRFQRGVGEALALLSDTFSAAREDGRDTLTLSVSPSFATEFLARRLGGFQFAHPGIAVRVMVDQALSDFTEVDLVIRHGRGDWPGTDATFLLDAAATPMLTPTLAETIGGVRAPEDLLKLPLLEEDDPWWAGWFEMMGVERPDRAAGGGVTYGAQNLEAGAALAGRGVGKFTPLLFQEALANGSLIRPFAETHGDGRGFWLVRPNARREGVKERRFRDWLERELASA